MKPVDLHFMSDLANDRIAQKQNELDLLTLLQKYGGHEKFGYTKEELNAKIEELKNYIYIATH